MWVEIVCGLIIYRLVKRFFYDDDLLDLNTSDSSALFSVADRVEKIFGGKAYVGLKIPDADTASPQSIDIVLVPNGDTEDGALVISVKNLSGVVSMNPDGTWTCTSHDSTIHLPNPVEEATKQASVLESYLEQRGLALPRGYFTSKVILPNPKCCTMESSRQVISYDEWAKLKAEEKKSLLSGWLWRIGKKEMQESSKKKLNFILTTAPMWDRLEVRGKKYMILGEFVELKGKQEDVHALRNIKRSKVARLLIQKTSMLGFAHSRLQVLYSPRDYRSEGASSSEWKEVSVRSSTELVFRPQNSNKVHKFKLSSIVSMSLSA